jgi:hypothetical protein
MPANIDNLKLETAVQSFKYQKFEILVLKFLKYNDLFKISKTSEISPG